MHKTESGNKTNSPVISDAEPVPVRRGLPGVGVAFQLHQNALDFFADTVKQYGDRVELRVLGRRILLLSNPADVNDVLIRNAADFGRSPEVKSLRQVFGDGIYSSEGQRWERQRKALQPAFHHERILKYSSIILKRMKERTGTWRHGQTLVMFGQTSAFTTDVICEVIFGPQQGSDAKAIANAASVIFKDLRAEILYLSLWRRLPFSRSRRWNRALKILDTAIDNIIAASRFSSPDSEELLGRLLAAETENGAGMSDQDVRDEVMTMFLTGQEVPAVALSWAVALLAKHPELQEEAAAEIADLTNGREVMAEDYSRLKLLHAVVHETLRLYPPLWTLGRNTIHDTWVGNLPVRSGTEVWIPVFQIHRDARWFPQPDRFDPCRWSDGTRRPKLGYFPFGAGPRSCVAQHFAMAEVVLGLAVMLSRFRFRSALGADMATDAWLTLRPKNGVPVVVSSR